MYHARRHYTDPNPSGLCQCGCGQQTPLAVSDGAARGGSYVGTHLRYAPGHHVGKAERHPKWKGGRWTHKTGYVYVFAPDHPDARNKYILEHRHVMEQHLGRRLLPSEHVHHINGIRTDNALDNLVVLTKAEHYQLHKYALVEWALKHPERAREVCRDAQTMSVLSRLAKKASPSP